MMPRPISYSYFDGCSGFRISCPGTLKTICCDLHLVAMRNDLPDLPNGSPSLPARQRRPICNQHVIPPSSAGALFAFLNIMTSAPVPPRPVSVSAAIAAGTADRNRKQSAIPGAEDLPPQLKPTTDTPQALRLCGRRDSSRGTWIDRGANRTTTSGCSFHSARVPLHVPNS